MGSGMLVLHRSREAAKARLSRCRSTSARSRGLGMVEDRVAETDQGLTCRSAQTACSKKLAIAARNKTAASPKQAAQFAAIRMIRPDSAGHSGPEDDGADLVLAGGRLFEVDSPEYVRPARHLLRRNPCRYPRSDRKPGTG